MLQCQSFKHPKGQMKMETDSDRDKIHVIHSANTDLKAIICNLLCDKHELKKIGKQNEFTKPFRMHSIFLFNSKFLPFCFVRFLSGFSLFLSFYFSASKRSNATAGKKTPKNKEQTEKNMTTIALVYLFVP